MQKVNPVIPPVVINKDALETIAAFEQAALRTAPPVPDNYDEKARLHDLLHAVLGFVTEAAELADVLKKHIAYDKPLDFVNLQEELGDVLWYAPLACRALGTDMQSIVHININKLAKRYPSKFSTVEAIHRDTDAERRLLDHMSYSGSEKQERPNTSHIKGVGGVTTGEITLKPIGPLPVEEADKVANSATNTQVVTSSYLLMHTNNDLPVVVHTPREPGINRLCPSLYLMMPGYGMFGPYFDATLPQFTKLAEQIVDQASKQS